MGRVVNIVYGVILVLLALVLIFAEDSAFGIPAPFLWGLVSVMGILILFTPIRNPTYGEPLYGTLAPRPRFQWLRRWVFGIFILISGLLPFMQVFVGSFPWGAYASVETFSGQVILLLIGVIYLLLSFARTRQMRIASV